LSLVRYMLRVRISVCSLHNMLTPIAVSRARSLAELEVTTLPKRDLGRGDEQVKSFYKEYLGIETCGPRKISDFFKSVPGR